MSYKRKCGCTIADGEDTAVRKGYELGGYVKSFCEEHEVKGNPMTNTTELIEGVNLPRLTRKIRDCEGEVAAQLVLEHTITLIKDHYREALVEGVNDKEACPSLIISDYPSILWIQKKHLIKTINETLK